MVRRAQEPQQDVTLTGDTNRQDFPARVVGDDKAQDDNAKRVQAAKDADRSRQLLKAQRDALAEKPASKTLDAGTKVTGDADTLARLR